MSVNQATNHGKKYSQIFKKGFGLWKDDFDAMAIKTVLKALLAKFAPMSIEMQKAVIADQGVINDHETEDITYVDNEPMQIDKVQERVTIMLQEASTLDELDKVTGKAELTPEQLKLYDEKKEELKNGKR